MKCTTGTNYELPHYVIVSVSQWIAKTFNEISLIMNDSHYFGASFNSICKCRCHWPRCLRLRLHWSQKRHNTANRHLSGYTLQERVATF